ncbi:MAG: protein kinase [Oligoflexales bacterium]|nr:protein kinase [Oligoflexales bacterium]
MEANFRSSLGHRIANRYSLVDIIGSGAMGVVYRGVQLENPINEVAIKVIVANKKIDYNELVRFQKEAALMSQLIHPNIICFRELGLIEKNSKRFAGGCYIVMEIAEGLNLKQIILRDGPKDLDFFFDIAIQIASALDYTHGKKIIHRDIKPHNVIVAESRQRNFSHLVKVLDFGVARRITDLINSVNELDDNSSTQLAGTPLYMAPEQTGLIKASIDHRVDLYSLGCLLYEVLSGKPPFMATTLKDLQNAHAHKIPENLATMRPDLPPLVIKLVERLLAKEPTNRYPHSFGLLADLWQLRSSARHLTVQNDKSGFELGSRDKFNPSLIKNTFLGRKTELSIFLKSFENLKSDGARSQIVALSGGIGVGKTFILEGYKRILAEEKIRFITCTFNQYDNSLPFNAIANAFNEYLADLNSYRPREAEMLGDSILKVLGASWKYVADVIPAVSQIGKISYQKKSIRDNDELSIYDIETQVQFKKAFSDFVKCLSGQNQTLVFFFDNLQWADNESLRLLDDLISHNTLQKYQIVLSFQDHRDNPALSLLLEKHSKLKRRFQSIQLEGLQLNDLKILLATIFPDGLVDEDFLLQELWKTTKGNPLEFIETLKQFVANNIIFFSNNKRWHINKELLIHSADFPQQNADLVLKSLQKLGQNELKILRHASVIGMRFLTGLLPQDSADADVLSKLMTRSLEAGILVQSWSHHTIYKHGRAYEFAHSSIRDSIYNEIPKNERSEFHFECAKKIEGMLELKDDATKIALAHHYSIAAESSAAVESTLQKALTYAHFAAKISVSNLAYLAADRYYSRAYTLFRRLENGNKNQLVSLLEEWSDVYYSLGKWKSVRLLLIKLIKISEEKNRRQFVANLFNIEVYGGQINKALEIDKRYGSKILPRSSKGFARIFENMLRFPCLYLLNFPPLRRIFLKLISSRLYIDALKAAVSEDRFFDNSFSKYFIGRYHLSFTKSKLRLQGLFSYLARLLLGEETSLQYKIQIVAILANEFRNLGFKKFSLELLEIVEQECYRSNIEVISKTFSATKEILFDLGGQSKSGKIQKLENQLHQPHYFSDYGEMACRIMEYSLLLDFRNSNWQDFDKKIFLYKQNLPENNIFVSRINFLCLFTEYLKGNITEILEDAGRYLELRETSGARYLDLYSHLIELLVGICEGDLLKVIQNIETLEENSFAGSVDSMWPFEMEHVVISIGFLFKIVQIKFGLSSRDFITRAEKAISKIFKLCDQNRISEPFNYYVRNGCLLSLSSEKYQPILEKIRLKMKQEGRITEQLIFDTLRFLTNPALADGSFAAFSDRCSRRDLHGLLELVNEVKNEKEIVYSNENEDFGAIDGQLMADIYRCIHLQEKKKINGLEMPYLLSSLKKVFEFSSLHILFWSREKDSFESFYSSDVSSNDIILNLCEPYAKISFPLILPKFYASDATGEAGPLNSGEMGFDAAVFFSDANSTKQGNKSLDDQLTVLRSPTEMERTLQVEDISILSTENINSSSKSTNNNGSCDLLVPLSIGGHYLGLMVFSGLKPKKTANNSQIVDWADRYGKLLCYALFLSQTTNKNLENFSNIPVKAMKIGSFRPSYFQFDVSEEISIFKSGSLDFEHGSRWARGVNIANKAYISCSVDIQSQNAGGAQLLAASLWHAFNLCLTGFQVDGAIFNLADLERIYLSIVNVLGSTDTFERLDISFQFIDLQDRRVQGFFCGNMRPIVLGRHQILPLREKLPILSSGERLHIFNLSYNLDRVAIVLQLDGANAKERLVLRKNLVSLAAKIGKAKNAVQAQILIHKDLVKSTNSGYYICFLPKLTEGGVTGGNSDEGRALQSLHKLAS